MLTASIPLPPTSRFGSTISIRSGRSLAAV
jgi:hypothetical protein